MGGTCSAPTSVVDGDALQPVAASGSSAMRQNASNRKSGTREEGTSGKRRRFIVVNKRGASSPAEAASGPAVTAAPSSSSSPSSPPSPSSSPLDRLGEDLLLTVLSYVSYAPGEAAPVAWSLQHHARRARERARRRAGMRHGLVAGDGGLGGRGGDDDHDDHHDHHHPAGGITFASDASGLMGAYNEEALATSDKMARAGGRRKKGKGGKGRGKSKKCDEGRCALPNISPFREASYYYQMGFGDSEVSGGAAAATRGTSRPCRAAAPAKSSSSESSSSAAGTSLVRSVRNFGTLTHVLPLVCRRWHALCGGSIDTTEGGGGGGGGGDGLTSPSQHYSTDFLWREALTRLAAKREDWSEGLAEYAMAEVKESAEDAPPSGGIGAQAALPEPSDVASSPASTPVDVDLLVERACHMATGMMQSLEAPVGGRWPQHSTPAAVIGPAVRVYRDVRSKHLRSSLPVFYLPMTQPMLREGRRFLSIGRAVSLHLFEPRYRLMISELMKDRSMAERNGVPLSSSGGSPRPRFLYAYEAPLGRGSGAFVVEVRRCVLHDVRGNGTADVVIVPTEDVVLDRVTERPNSGRLYDATSRGVGVGVRRRETNDGDADAGAHVHAYIDL